MRALLGALVIRQIESLGRGVLSDAATFVVSLVLVVRPRGLFGAPTGARA